ncbi:Uncharacterised protein [Bordetella pertussis]|nr:Uncharacterised protein [Bordetella pertussis]CPK91986.1 Uncharacterised protein [Bordetella pertussis]CPM74138.1 Uncharacterised protein [Bordetella pertussis]
MPAAWPVAGNATPSTPVCVFVALMYTDTFGQP